MAKLYLVLPLLGILIAASGATCNTDATLRTVATNEVAGKSIGRRTRSLLQTGSGSKTPSPPPAEDYAAPGAGPDIEYDSPSPDTEYGSPSPGPVNANTAPAYAPTPAALPPTSTVPAPLKPAIIPPLDVTGTGTVKAPPAQAPAPASSAGGLFPGAIAGIVIAVVAGLGGTKSHQIIFLFVFLPTVLV